MIVLLDNMTEQQRDKVNYEVARRLVTEAKFGSEHLLEPETFKVDANQDSACIAQQLYAENMGIVSEEATETDDTIMEAVAPVLNNTPVLAV